MTIEHKVVPFALKATADDGGSFSGLGAVFNNVDRVGDIIAPGAFIGGLRSFLTDGFIGGLNHDWNQPIGKPTSAVEGPMGLFIEGTIVDTAHGSDVRKLMKAGVIGKLSIGYEATEFKMLTPEDTKAYWKTQNYMPSESDTRRAGKPVRLLTAIRLHEVSPVTMPANDRASVSAVKGDLLGDTDEPMAHAAVCSLLDGLCSFLHSCINDETLDGGTARLDRMQAGTDEFAAALPAVAGLIAESDDDTPGAYPAPDLFGYMGSPDVAALKNHFVSVLAGKADSALPFATFSHQVVSANREFLAKVRMFAEQRQKSGRVLSAANRQRISAAIESMKPCLDDLTALLAATDPTPPKAAEPDELRRKRYHFLASLALLD